jgi:hypothetical protein
MYLHRINYLQLTQMRMKTLLRIWLQGFTVLVFYFTSVSFGLTQNLNWIKQIAGSGSDYIKGMTTDAAGNVYVVGGFTGTIDFDPGPGIATAGPAVGSDIWFAKYSPTGQLIWARALIGGDNDFGNDIGLDNSGNIYITGYFGTTTAPLDFDPGFGNAPPTVQHGLFVARYNNNGNFIWVKTIGAPFVETRATSIAVDGFGNSYIAGTIISTQTRSIDFGMNPLSTGTGSIFYAKFNSAGGNQYAKNVGPGNTAGVKCNDIALDGSGNVYITGFFNGTADFHPSSTTPLLNSANGSAYVCKYNSSGNFVWTKQVSGQAGDIGNACTVDAAGNVYITGSQNINGQNIFLSKFNSSGVALNTLSIGGSFSDTGQPLKLDGSNLYLAGFFYGSNVNFNPIGSPILVTSSPNFYDFFLAKYSTSNLDCQWARSIDLQLEYPDFEINGIVLSNGKVVAAGNFVGNGDFNSCGSSDVYTASTIDGFLVGYTTSIEPLNISGPAIVCSEGSYTFTVTNPPAGATINWSVTPSNGASPSTGTGTSFTINALNNSISSGVLIQANVSGSCPVSGQISAWVGKAQSTTGMSYNLLTDVPSEICAVTNSQADFYTMTTPASAQYFEWETDAGSLFYPNPSYIFNPNNTTVNTVTFPGGIAYYPDRFIRVRAVNECGSSDWTTRYFNLTIATECQGGGIGFSMSPNPSSDNLSVELTGVSSEKSSFDEYYNLQLVNKDGVILLNKKTRDISNTIDIKGFAKETYYIRIVFSDKTLTQRLVIY